MAVQTSTSMSHAKYDKDGRFKIWNIYCITLIVAASSILYELMCAQMISQLAANTVKWYSITIGVYLASMGIGALSIHHLSKRWGTWTALFYVEIALSLLGAVVVLLINTAHIGYTYLNVNMPSSEPQLLFFASTILVIFLVGLLTGFELPLLIDAGNAISGQSKETNRVLGVDYLGSLLGSMAFPLLLLPHLGLMRIGFLVASLNCAVAIWIIQQSPRTTPRIQKFTFIGVFALAIGAGIWNVGTIEQYFLKKYYYYFWATESLSTLFSSMDAYPPIVRKRSPYQNIDLVQSVNLNFGSKMIEFYSTKYADNPDYPIATKVYLNRDFQIYSRNDEVYHEFFAHVPIIKANRVPEEILVLGAGDGLLIKELLKYPQVRSITQVDLDPVLVEMASTQHELRKMSKGALLDPRVHITIGDGYQYIRKLNRKFSAIYIDFPFPVDYNLAKLYSSEFFFFVRQHLTEGGFAAFDASDINIFTPPDVVGARELLPESDWPVYYNTLRAAGFKTIIPYVTSIGFTNQKAVDALNQVDPPISASEWDNSDAAREFASREDYLFKRSLAISAYLTEFAISNEQGFIMVVNGPMDASRKYHDFGIKLDILNAERYRLSFNFPFDQPDTIDKSKVNSIMRPTLPTLPITYIRLPAGR